MKKIFICLLFFTFFLNIFSLEKQYENPVILIHGYYKDKSDMEVLSGNLQELNMKTIVVDLPLSYTHFEYAAEIFKKKLEEIREKNPKAEKFHLVGHSTGGLVIRQYLKSPLKNVKIGRCVQIATPNNGSELADFSYKYLPIFFHKYKTLSSIQTERVKKLKLPEKLPVEIGAIAGDESNSFFSIFLTGKDDGRVSLNSVKFSGLKDFLRLPFGHKEIHYKKSTAIFVKKFIIEGKF